MSIRADEAQLKEMNESKNLNDYFERRINNYLDLKAVTDRYCDLELTYQDIKNIIHQFAGGLQSLGIKKGDFIGLFTENNGLFMATSQAIIKTGAIEVLRGSNAPIDELDYILGHSEAKCVIVKDEKLLENMREAGQPWAVSSLAQAAGVAALDETEYADHVRSLIARERPRMIASLRSLGLRVLEGQANFLLFKAPEDFGERLKEKGAVVRGCANYPGLDNTWYRTAVRTPEENETLLKIMREVLK